MNSSLHILKIKAQLSAQNRVQIRDWKFDLLVDFPIDRLEENQHFLALQSDYPKLVSLIDSIPFHRMTRIPL